MLRFAQHDSNHHLHCVEALGLPGIFGFRLVRLLRRDPKWQRIPVVVVTAFQFEEVEELADEGVQGFITKPFDPVELVSKLEYALSRPAPLAGDRATLL